MILKHKRSRVLQSFNGIFVPMALQMLMYNVLSASDLIMLTYFESDSAAASGYVSRFIFVAIVFLSALSTVSSMLGAQYFGSGKRKKMFAVHNTSLYIGLVISALAFLINLFFSDQIWGTLVQDNDLLVNVQIYASYMVPSLIASAAILAFESSLRIDEQARAVSIIGGISVVLNLVLNYLLIYDRPGFEGMGIEGAGIATLIARISHFVLLLGYLFIKSGFRESVFDFYYDHHYGKNFVLTSANELIWLLTMLVYLVCIGVLPAASVLVFNYFNLFDSLVMSLYLSASIASSIYLGGKIGSSQVNIVRVAARLFEAWLFRASLIFCMLALAGYLSLAHFLPDVYQLGSLLALVCILVLLLRSMVTFYIVGVLRAGLDSGYVFKVEFGVLVCFILPVLGYIYFFDMLTIAVIFAVMLIEELLKLLIFKIRLRSADWLKSALA
ncbi:MATE family efflux transporter [Motilimonas cestriensis]|uniref:MATE family efflux transporter n=1 Tax=Motilimonas cestriensis TaxID=2742685 RepID=UPI003DA3822B